MKLKLTLISVLTILSILLSACNLGAPSVPSQDPGAIQTQAMETVVAQIAAQQTQTAMAAPPASLSSPTALSTAIGIPTSGVTTPGAGTPFASITPPGGFTPLASPIPTISIGATVSTANGCNDGLYIGETAPFDKDVVKAGEEFSKAWQIENTGTCTWDEGYVFAFLPEISSPDLKGYSIVIKKNDSENFTPPKHSQTFVVKLVAPSTAGEYKAFWKLKDDLGNYFGPQVYVYIVVQ